MIVLAAAHKRTALTHRARTREELDVTKSTPLLYASPVTLIDATAPTCAMHLAKSRADYFRRSGRQHVSLQASLFDLHRLYSMLPLVLTHDAHHTEERRKPRAAAEPIPARDDTLQIGPLEASRPEGSKGRAGGSW